MEHGTMLAINKEGWNKVAPHFLERTKDVLSYGPYAPTEDELQLLGDIEGCTMLEVGCGSGHTLEYLARHGAKELWGVDLSTTQIETAQQTISDVDIPVTLIESPMEHMSEVPREYFDAAVSIYALGWTIDLPKTLANVYRSLKRDGRFVFSWEHPLHSSLATEDDRYYIQLPYVHDHTMKWDSFRGEPVIAHHRKLSTFINALIRTGFVIDAVIEESRIPPDDASSPQQWYSAARANLIPLTFIIQSHKA